MKSVLYYTHQTQEGSLLDQSGQPDFPDDLYYTITSKLKKVVS